MQKFDVTENLEKILGTKQGLTCPCMDGHDAHGWVMWPAGWVPSCRVPSMCRGNASLYICWMDVQHVPTFLACLQPTWPPAWVRRRRAARVGI